MTVKNGRGFYIMVIKTVLLIIVAAFLLNAPSPSLDSLANVLFLAAVILYVFWIGYWFIHFIAIIYSNYKLYGQTCQLRPSNSYPGVSILKPLTGVDSNLFSNLETFFTMKYPRYELLFCISDKDDPTLELVENLIKKYPDIDASVFVGGDRVGVNRKINNLQPGYSAAKYDLFVISDSGIRMKEDTLMDMVIHMEEDVALVHQLPYVCDRQGFPATLEKVYFGTAHARNYLVADFFRVNCVSGMSSLMRKSVIDEAGGLKAFGSYLAEDFFLAKAVTDRGWRIRISRQPAWQNSGTCDIPSLLERVTRWTKLRIAMAPITILLEPMSECMVLGILAAWANYWLFARNPLGIYLLHILAWIILDYILLKTIIDSTGLLPLKKSEFIFGWFLRELSALFIFINALCRPTIRWKAGTYRLRWGGVVEEIDNQNSDSIRLRGSASAALLKKGN